VPPTPHITPVGKGKRKAEVIDVSGTPSTPPITHVGKGKEKVVEVIDISDSEDGENRESPGPSFKRKRTELVVEDFIEITSEEDDEDYDGGSAIEITDSD
jgi:hypothetical protein